MIYNKTFYWACVPRSCVCPVKRSANLHWHLILWNGYSILIEFLRSILTLTVICNTGETGDMYHLKKYYIVKIECYKTHLVGRYFFFLWSTSLLLPWSKCLLTLPKKEGGDKGIYFKKGALHFLHWKINFPT